MLNNTIPDERVFDTGGRRTLADVLADCEATLTGAALRDTRSAFRFLADKRGVDLAATLARPPEIRQIFAPLSPARLGISEKRFANIRSLVGSAVARFGMRRTWITREIPLDEAWCDLLARIPDRQHRWGLSRLACYATVKGILTVCPLRLRNLAMMKLGKHLYQVGPEWRLSFDGGETKTGQPIHLVIPRELTPLIAVFLERVRPAFPGAADGTQVWPACKGRPMAAETIYMRVIKRTRELFGVAINPHAFRSIAATFLAESSPTDALYARPLLGHRQSQTTERYYIRASQIDAARTVSTALRGIRDA